jgi:hypothetical protein
MLGIAVIALSIITGIMFIACIPAVGNREKSLAIHKEMPPTASDGMIRVKNAVTIFGGIAFIIAVIGMFGGWKVALGIGVAGAGLFIAFYLVEVALWISSYPKVLGGFLVFGSISAFIGWYWLSRILGK